MSATAIYGAPELTTVLVWAFYEAEPETRTWVVYIGGGPLKQG